MSLEVFDIEKFCQNENMFIEASAGTGKTFTIQNIVSKLLCSTQDKINLSNILIVTYTEKAVGELRARIRSKIEDEINSIKDNDEKKQIFLNALRQVDEAPIFTIHSFCQRTLKEFSYEANIPFAMSMASDNELENFVDKYIRDDLPLDDTFKFIVKNSFKTLKKIRAKLIGALKLYNDDVDILKLEKNNFVIKNLNDEQIASLINFSCFDDFLALEEFSKNVEFLKENSTCQFTKSKTCKDFLDSLIESSNSSGKIDFAGNIYQARYIVQDDMKSVFDYFYKLKDIEIFDNAINYFEYKLYFNQVPVLYNKWQKYKHENKLQTFNDMLDDVRKAVCKSENSILLEKLRKIYRYAIIDEFQDTNQIQWDIFKKIFFDSDKNNIIVVGDPKQSIYSFQGADLTVYQKAVDTIATKGKGYKLDTNYRSTNQMIEACNMLFPNFEFTKEEQDDSKKSVGSKTFNFVKSNTPKDDNIKHSPLFNNQEVEPIWISSPLSDKDFSTLAVQKIVECCAIDKNGKTALQIFDKKNCKKLRNVKFSDFAILARTRTEMEYIESEMKKVGVPFLRYKDSNLFNSRQAHQWIAILKAIVAPDFAAYNRQILSSVLVTDFFHYHWKEASDEKFDNPKEEPLSIILEWQKIAKQRKWALLQEKIYSDTKIEEYLSSPTQLQEIAKFHQIGTYIFNYLYEQNSSVEDAIKNLEFRAMNVQLNEDDTGDDLIARGSDFDVVQIMTIHASKGLEFPVVISVAGAKDYNNMVSGPFLFHNADDNSKKYLGFSEIAKNTKKAEDIEEEWFRLFYVAYTRASSLMILPYFESFDKKANLFFITSKKMLDGFVETKKSFVKQISIAEKSIAELKEEVKLILKNTTFIEDENIDAQKIQKQKIENLVNKIDDSKIQSHSYSSLSSKNKMFEEQEQNEQINNRIDKEIEFEAIKKAQKDFDCNAVVVKTDKYDLTEKNKIVPEEFPCGAKFGNAIHKVFELYNFSNINDSCFEEFVKEDFSDKLKLKNYLLEHSQILYLFELVKTCLIEEKFSEKNLDKHNDWIVFIIKMIFNTLNALLPEVCGCNKNFNNKFFALKDLQKSSYKSELEFNLNANDDFYFKNYVTGFIDLLFVRKQMGQDGKQFDCYSILDWKTDRLDSEDEQNRYANIEELKNEIDEHYSIQRVLYSYFLIQWLKQFSQFSSMTEEQIFQNHFGGIYYVLVRGTKKDTQNGIYVQTWNSYSDLKDSFEKIKKLIQKR